MVGSSGSRAGRGFDDSDRDADERAFKRLTADEAAALRARHPSLSPWRVIAVQAGLGILLSLLAGAVLGSRDAALSALYGAFVVVLPGALMARGTTRRYPALSAPANAARGLVWAVVKIAASVVMLLLAPRLVGTLHWPVLLGSLVACMQVYWLALLWRGR